MRRMVQFKEKATSQEAARLSLLTYPALMAADILSYKTNIVPVGEDQRQHLELTRTLARRFNYKYGETFVIPEGVTPKETARIKDLKDPSQKMGKTGSNGNGTLFLRDSKDVLISKIKKAVTDNDPILSYDVVNRPGVANLATLLGAFTDVSPQEALEGLKGSGELKAALIEATLSTLLPIQQRYEELKKDPELLKSLLKTGCDTVTPLAEETLKATRTALGLVALN